MCATRTPHSAGVRLGRIIHHRGNMNTQNQNWFHWHYGRREARRLEQTDGLCRLPSHSRENAWQASLRLPSTCLQLESKPPRLPTLMSLSEMPSPKGREECPQTSHTSRQTGERQTSQTSNAGLDISTNCRTSYWNLLDLVLPAAIVSLIL